MNTTVFETETTITTIFPSPEYKDRFIHTDVVENPIPWPDPTSEQFNSELFDQIWNVIHTWDINVPEVYNGYCGATGNHVVAIMNGITLPQETLRCQ
jgi:hypothetical protein